MQIEILCRYQYTITVQSILILSQTINLIPDVIATRLQSIISNIKVLQFI